MRWIQIDGLPHIHVCLTAKPISSTAMTEYIFVYIFFAPRFSALITHRHLSKINRKKAMAVLYNYKGFCQKHTEPLFSLTNHTVLESESKRNPIPSSTFTFHPFGFAFIPTRPPPSSYLYRTYHGEPVPGTNPIRGVGHDAGCAAVPISGCGNLCACAVAAHSTKNPTAAGRFQMSTTCYSQKSAIKMCITDTFFFSLVRFPFCLGGWTRWKRGLCNRTANGEGGQKRCVIECEAAGASIPSTCHTDRPNARWTTFTVGMRGMDRC